MIKAYGERLSEAVKKGYGKDYVDIDFNTPDYKKLHSLEKNVWQFSSAKTYTQLRQMSDALRKPDGTLRSFEEFRIQTTIITGQHLRHLKTEHETAIAGSQMASKWQSIQESKEDYPLLEFVAIEDGHTTALCISLNGVIKSVDNPFWSKFYPPNHYNCRSSVKQLRKGTITPDDKVVQPDVPEIFKVNLGERGLAFPEDHAYFEGMPAEVMEESRQYFPYNLQFDILEESDKSSGIVRRHFIADKTGKDHERIVEIATSKAREEKVIVDILPTLDPTTYHDGIRTIIFPDAKFGKSPDLRINKILYEEEASTKSGNINNIKHAIGAGSKQSDHVIITLSEKVDKQSLDRLANGRWKDHKDLLIIEFRYEGEVWEYKRP